MSSDHSLRQQRITSIPNNSQYLSSNSRVDDKHQIIILQQPPERDKQSRPHSPKIIENHPNLKQFNTSVNRKQRRTSSHSHQDLFTGNGNCLIEKVVAINVKSQPNLSAHSQNHSNTATGISDSAFKLSHSAGQIHQDSLVPSESPANLENGLFNSYSDRSDRSSSTVNSQKSSLHICQGDYSNLCRQIFVPPSILMIASNITPEKRTEKILIKPNLVYSNKNNNNSNSSGADTDEGQKKPDNNPIDKRNSIASIVSDKKKIMTTSRIQNNAVVKVKSNTDSHSLPNNNRSRPSHHNSPTSGDNRKTERADKKCCFCWCGCCKCSWLPTQNERKSSIKKRESKHESIVLTEAEPITYDEVRTWGTSFERVMKTPNGRATFRDFLKHEYSEENMLFYLACEELKKEKSQEAIEEKARLIYEDYISILSPKEVSLDSRVREIINQKMVDPTKDTFEEAQLQIYTLMHRDSYPRFLNSVFYKKLLDQYKNSTPENK
ncbi:unnamed protein product [Gordionus sp. m RMFG-2023]|uniref:putative uncharacterized protein DDB_G0285119 n=1 Tax=Gordionus sp. m RMFG-2023 TaxID=3053472 RepID=UPI0030E45732